MFPLLLFSIVIVPVLFGIQAATSRRGLFALLGLVLAYNVLYILMLHYLRFRWVG